jgi:hypothetical protein
MGANMACKHRHSPRMAAASRRGAIRWRLELMARYDMALALLVRELAHQVQGNAGIAAGRPHLRVGTGTAPCSTRLLRMTLVLARKAGGSSQIRARPLSTITASWPPAFARGLAPETVSPLRNT